MKKSKKLQLVLDKMLYEIGLLKTDLREDEWDYLEYKFSSFEAYLRGKIDFEQRLEKNEEGEE